jgi:glycosyltransferase involved in cell wall biosynthesis
MYRLLKDAQAVTFRYHTEAECYWRAYPGALNTSQIHIIPNGYEGTVEKFDVPKGEFCRILYAGTLESYRYDTLLQALRIFKHQDAVSAKHLRISFVGEESEKLLDQASALGVADLIEISGPKPHDEIMRLQSEAHGLLILGRPSTMKGYELFAGAKLFGYLKVGRPIVGILPADETRKILRRVGGSTVTDVDSPVEIATLLKRFVEAWSDEQLHLLVPDAVACEVFSAPQQTLALVRALEGLPSADPFIPGNVIIPPSLKEDLGYGAWINCQSFARG